MLNHFSDDELIRYSRHLLLPGFGLEGQDKLKQSKVMIVGAGGLGHPLSLYLAAAGVGTIHLVDEDHVELSNLQRQIAFKTNQLGQPKAQTLAHALQELNPDIHIYPEHWRFDQGHQLAAQTLLNHCDLVFDCSDNFATRYQLNQLSRRTATPMVSGAATGYQGVVAMLNQTPTAPCYACLFDPQEIEPTTRTCSESGVFSPLLGMAGSSMAMVGLNWLLNPEDHQTSLVWHWDCRRPSIRHSRLEQRTDCNTCTTADSNE